MDATTAFLIYASLFRLAVIAAGVISIILGFRLFVRGVMPEGATDAEAQAGDIKLTVKNAAPGTCFAMFGALIIVVMVWQGIPELKGTKTLDRTGERTEFSLRGQESGDVKAAISAYASALSNASRSLGDAVEPLTGLASVYRQQKRFDEALAYVRLAHQIRPNAAAPLVVIAQIERDRGRLDEAIRAMKHAAERDPALHSEVTELEKLLK